MPNLTEDGWNSFADIYPTGAVSNFSVDIDEEGRNTTIQLGENNKRLMRRVRLHKAKSTTFSFIFLDKAYILCILFSSSVSSNGIFVFLPYTLLDDA